MNIFDKVISKKKSPTISSSINEEDEEARSLIEKERSRHERPFKAFGRGAIEGTGTLGDILSLTGYPSGQVAPAEKIKAERESKLLSPEKEKEFANSIISEAAESDIAPPFLGTLPTSKDTNEFLNMLGIPKEEIRPKEKFMGRWGRFVGATPGWPGSIAVSGTGALGGQAAEEAGFGPMGQMIAEIGSSLRFPKKPSLQKLNKINQPRVVTKNILPNKGGAITQQRLESQLSRVNREAAEIAKDIGSRNKKFSVVSEAIDKKYPIDKKFDAAFDTLENISKAHNSHLKNTKPLYDFLDAELSKYANTGAPTFMSEFIKKEAEGLLKSCKNELYPMFRRYRLNNQRFKEVRTDPNFPLAFKTEALCYLSRMNKAIDESISQSLPKDSSWTKSFRGLNDMYGAYQNTKTVKKILDPILQKTVDDKKLKSFLSNTSTWEEMERFLGPQEASNLKEVLTDLQQARSALQSMKRMPGIWEGLKEKGMLGALGFKTLAALLSVPYATKWAVGRYFSSPEFATNMKELSKALLEENIPAISNALKKIEEKDKED